MKTLNDEFASRLANCPERRLILVLVLLITLVNGCSDQDQPTSGGDSVAADAEVSHTPPAWMTESVIRQHNAAVASMGAFDYPRAVEGFSRLVAQFPDWDFARINLAIATLNRQQPGDEDQALAIASDVLTRDPDHLRALYISGILYFNRGEVTQAESFFARVHQLDPDDAFAAYYTAQSRLQLGQIDSALTLFDHAIEADPYLRSAYYGAFGARQRLGDREAALNYLTQYQRLEQNPRSTLAEIKYTRMGEHAMALPIRQSHAIAEPELTPMPAQAVTLGERTALAASAPIDTVTASAVLLDGTVSMILLATEGRLAAWQLDSGQWQPSTDLPFLETEGVTTISFGDVDADGLTDLYLGREGLDQLWMQTAAGWVQSPERLVDVIEPVPTLDSQWIDADHDGDLDLLLRLERGVRLINNDGNDRFRELTDTAIPQWREKNLKQLLAEDIDADRDLDLIAVDEQGTAWLYRNDRLWAYQHEALVDEDSAIALLQLIDMDVDGRIDAWLVDPAGALRRRTLGDDATTAMLATRDSLGLSQDARRMWRQDVDGDGRLDLMLAASHGFVIVDAQGEVLLRSSDEVRLLGLLQDQPQSGPALLTVDQGVLYRQSLDLTGRRYLTLSFSGQESAGESMRSNPSGLGTGFVVRTGSSWTADRLLRAHTGPGSDLQPVSIGLGQAEHTDYVAIEWSDGVFQTESALAAGQWHRLTETQRQLASCPVVFLDQGQGYEFVTDILGVGGIGFNTGFGQYSVPRPIERIVLPIAETPTTWPIRVKIAEPMEEIAYLDQIELWAVDVPPGHRMILNERLAMNGPLPDGMPVLIEQSLVPVAAQVHAEGQPPLDVQEALARTDLVPVPVGAEHRSLKGLLEDELIVEFEFDRDLGEWTHPGLQIDGWVEYGYSQTSFAAWQAGRVYDGLTLERLDASGAWVVLSSSFGYPAGMPRQSYLKLDPLPVGTHRLRLRTHQQIYLDHVAMLQVNDQQVARIHRIPVDRAAVSQQGYPRRSNGPDYQPSYDDRDRQPFWDTRYPSGYYTALGEATALVTEQDNALAIIGPADALELSFAQPPSPAPEGWSRYWVLSSIGWAKDMDLYTFSGETVEPLPADPDVNSGQASRLHSRYNTRFQSGR